MLGNVCCGASHQVVSESMTRSQVALAEPVCTSDCVWYIFTMSAARASVLFPLFPEFHEVANGAYFGGMFHHPASFSGSESGRGVVDAVPAYFTFSE
jgi:hypothetical protein